MPDIVGSGLLVGFCCTLVAFLFWPMLQAQWSVYHDHELMVYMGPSGHIGLLDIPRIILQTEVGHPGEVTRYRPTTYFMYIFQGVLWGHDPGWWHFGRIAMLAISLSAFALGMYRLFSPWIAAALSALLLTGTYWASVWIGLGPNEQYVILFGVPFVWSYLRLHGWPLAEAGHNRGKVLAWIICAVSAALLVGTKENVFVILPALLWLGYVSWRAEPRWDYRIALIGAVLLWAAFILTVIIVAVSRTGGDFYGNSIGLPTRLANLARTVPQSPLWIFAALMAGQAAGYLILRQARRPIGATMPRQLAIGALLQAGLLVLGLAHAFFYDGWPVGSRYAFPGEFYVFLAAVQLLYLVLAAVSLFRPNLRPVADWGIAAALAIATLLIGYGPLRTSLEAFIASSRAYTAQIDAVVARSAAQPDVPIIIESATPYDLEPVFSVNRFLTMRGVAAPMFLRLHDVSKASFPDQPFFYAMIDVLGQLSATGEVPPFGAAGTLPSPFLAKFEPISKLPQTGPCFAIRLASAPSSGCEVIAAVSY